MVAKMEKEKRISTKQLLEKIESLQNEVQHLRNENKELKTECASNTVSLSRLKIYIDENIAMLDKRILTQPIPMASDSAKPPVQKTTITVSRAAEVYKQFKQKQNGN